MTSNTRSGFFDSAHFRQFIKFAIVGAIGVVVNEGLLILLQSKGVYLLTAGAVAIETSILSNFVLNDLWTFKDRRSGNAAVRLVKFNVLMLAGLVVNLVILDAGTAYLGIVYTVANLIGIAAAFFLRYALSVKYAWMRLETVEEGSAGRAPQPLSDPQNAPA
jgi:dolichol-phosphate mannosyltransferase